MNKITMASSSHDLIQASINISIPDLCPIIFCDPANPSGFCPSPCLSLCSSICRYPLSSLIPPPPTTFSSDHQSDKITHKLIPYLIVTLAVLVTAFVLVCHYFIYVRFRRNTLRVRSLDNNINDRAVPGNQLLDQEHGPEIDHPIWYIRTLGLQSSVISAITVCKYKRGDGPVEGTDCAVCLSEFQEDETLRLLPKCNHAFHIPCIDTWLRSHTNCPICRAGIVANNVLIAPSPELTVSNLGNSGETRVEVLENNEESVNESESQAEHVHNFKKEASGILPMRRSVSMGCTSASMINLDTTTVVSLQSGHGSNNQLAKVSEYDVATSSNNIPVGNQNLVRLTGSSSLRRCCENGSSSIKRSQSCTGKFLLSQYSRNKDSTLPL